MQPEERTHPIQPEAAGEAMPEPEEAAVPAEGPADAPSAPSDVSAEGAADAAAENAGEAGEAEEEPELILKGYYAGAPLYGKNKAAKPKEKPADPRTYEERQRDFALKRQGKRRVVFAALPFVAVLVVFLLSYRTSKLLPNEGAQMLSDERLTAAQAVEDPETAFASLDAEQAKMLRETVQLIAQQRADLGLAPFTLEARLCTAAQTRAAEAAEEFSHTRPDGSSYQTAIARAGVQSGLTGEDIGTGYKTAESFVDALMKSDEHAAYLRSEEYRYFGVGIAENPADAKYKGFTFVVLFSR